MWVSGGHSRTKEEKEYERLCTLKSTCRLMRPPVAWASHLGSLGLSAVQWKWDCFHQEGLRGWGGDSREGQGAAVGSRCPWAADYLALQPGLRMWASLPRAPASLKGTSWPRGQFKGLSRVSSITTVQKHQFFSAQLSLWYNSHIHT